MIYIGADYAGFKHKKAIIKYLVRNKIQFCDVGTFSDKQKDDFTDYAKPVAEKVSVSKKNLGILICGTGFGMCIAANRFKRVRATLVQTVEQARWAKKYDNANVLCLSAWALKKNVSLNIVSAWLGAQFEPLPRRIRRFKKIDQW